MFYLVSSLAGGTGAGTVFDAAVLIRDAAQRLGIKPWIVGFLVLPSAFRQVLGDSTMRATQTRSFAAYRELVRLQTQAGQGVPLTMSYSLNHRVPVSDKLFDTVFLLDAQTTWKNLADAPPWAGISPSIADGLEVFIDNSAGGAILEDLINASARMANEVKIHDTLPAQFHALGSHKIVLPARQYAAIFANRLVTGFLEGALPYERKEGIPRLLRAELTDGDYQDRVQEFARKIPNLFTQVIDLLPSRSQDSDKRIRSFASKTLAELRPLLLPKARLEGGESLQLLMNNPLLDVQTGKEAQDEAADAARRLVRECERRLNDHWQKLESAFEQTVSQVSAEITVDVEHQMQLILNRELEEYASYPVGSAHTFLQQLALLCDDLKSKVLRKAGGGHRQPQRRSEFGRSLAAARRQCADRHGRHPRDGRLADSQQGLGRSAQVPENPNGLCRTAEAGPRLCHLSPHRRGPRVGGRRSRSALGRLDRQGGAESRVQRRPRRGGGDYRHRIGPEQGRRELYLVLWSSGLPSRQGG